MAGALQLARGVRQGSIEIIVEAPMFKTLGMPDWHIRDACNPSWTRCGGSLATKFNAGLTGDKCQKETINRGDRKKDAFLSTAEHPLRWISIKHSRGFESSQRLPVTLIMQMFLLDKWVMIATPQTIIDLHCVRCFYALWVYYILQWQWECISCQTMASNDSL